jgi:hypothetical protein
VIILLAADYDDARRWDDDAQLDEESILIAEPRDVQAHAKQLAAGARIVRTDRWQYNSAVVGALQALATRVPIADPTGLLGPIDRREGARSTEPAGTPPIGAHLTGTRARRQEPRGAYQ